MDKTININIAGTLFKIDEVAFRILRDYLQAINNRFRNIQGGNETIEDIETRISEIFLSQKGLAGVLTKNNVEEMISIIGKPEDFDQNEAESEQRGTTSSRKRMYRNPDDKIIGGVCSGLGAYLNTDPVLFRILFVILAAFFGIGFPLYIVLWIALPVANSDGEKREMYGHTYHTANSLHIKSDHPGNYSSDPNNNFYNNTSKAGNALNEIFRAIGRVLNICFRIIMIIIGVVFVLTGFLTILTLLMVFVFKLPWAFSTDVFDKTVVYFPDFLAYIVNPAIAPWIIALTLAAIILPLLALIYWGVKMIFWFKAKDGIVSLIAFVIWVLAVAALAIILFNEGISFAESARTTSQTILLNPPDTLYVISDNKVADLKFNKKFAVPDDEYTVFLVDSTERIFISPEMKLNISGKNLSKVEILKRSSGKTKNEAARKSESLIYNFKISNDTLYLDEYFTIPSGRKWTADFLAINLFIPEKTVLYFDSSSGNLFHRRIQITRSDNSEEQSYIENDTEPWELRNKYWSITEDGLKESVPISGKKK
jgi:phage shock protein PspC (stress-responsive transcriptional regulator)